MNKAFILKLLDMVLAIAEDYASSTANPIDDVIVKSAAQILRTAFGKES